MAKWIFEPGHSAAEFAVRHMMVSQLRGMFKNVHGSRIGFTATTAIDRHDFGVNWNAPMDRGGVAAA